MARVRSAVLVASAAALFCASARGDDWLDSPAAREFRDRVVLLALIHGESSGLDPRGYLIRTRMLRPTGDDCADVEVVTLQGGTEVRRETLNACKHK